MFLFQASFWQNLRFTALLALLLGLLGVQQCQRSAPARPAGFSPVGDAERTNPAAVPGTCLAFQARPVSYRPGGPQLGDTSTSANGNLGRKANPRSRWHLVPGPAYLVYPLPRRPKQAQLDIEAARAAQLHKI